MLVLFVCKDATAGLLTMWPMCGPGLFEFTEQIIPYKGLPNPALLMMCSEYELSVAKSGDLPFSYVGHTV